MDYRVVIEGDDVSGYSAYLPELPGCVAAAGTLEETQTLIAEAVEIHLGGIESELVGATSMHKRPPRPTLRFEMG